MTAQVRPLDSELRGRKLEPIPTDGREQASEEGDEDDPSRASAVAAATRCLLSHGGFCEEAVRAARRVQASAGQGERD